MGEGDRVGAFLTALQFGRNFMFRSDWEYRPDLFFVLFCF
uniref:Uncharacterized protein n=1 Tax=Anguilla anguilla TaxID=7936 RepID=A0A0E9WAY5_ANGAN